MQNLEMKAYEVIQQYKNGQRSFQGQNLRGANFGVGESSYER